MSHTVNNGVRIHYEVEGSGTPLVLQHGFSMSMVDWQQAGYVDALKRDYRVVLMDARGHGESEKPHNSTAYGLSSFIGDVVAVLDALDIKRAHFWGYSMGGWIGFGMAKEAPTRLRALVIGGQHAYERKLPPGLADGNDPQEFFTSFFARIGLDFDALSPEDKRRWLTNDARALAAAQQDRPSLETLLPKIQTPCLLYAGEADGVFEQALKSAGSIPGCTFVPLPDLDHGAAFDNAHMILPHVKDFLRRADTAAE